MWWLNSKRKKKVDPYKTPWLSVYPSLLKEHNESNRSKGNDGAFYQDERTTPDTTAYGEERHTGDGAAMNLDKTFGTPGVDYDSVWPVNVCASIRKWLKM